MSNPTRAPAATPACCAAAAAPTIPPAGPDRIVSLASRAEGSSSAPLDPITRSAVASPKSPRTWAR